MHVRDKAISTLIKFKLKLSNYWNIIHRMVFVLSFLTFSLTGGAISNIYSVMIARYKHFPEVKTKGMTAAPRLVLFTSEHVCIVSYWKINTEVLKFGIWDFMVDCNVWFLQSIILIKKCKNYYSWGRQDNKKMLENSYECHLCYFIPFTESLLYKESQCSSWLWDREPDSAEYRWEVRQF